MISEKLKSDLYESYKKYTLEKDLVRITVTEHAFAIFFFERRYTYIFSVKVHIKIDLFSAFLKEIGI